MAASYYMKSEYSAYANFKICFIIILKCNKTYKNEINYKFNGHNMVKTKRSPVFKIGSRYYF